MSYQIIVRNLSKEYERPAAARVPAYLRRLAVLAGVSANGHEAPGPKVALNNVSFSVVEGERVGIIGENGAGKSTLLHILAGVATATRGSVQIEGRVHAALTVGLGLREDLTGRENLYLEADIHGQSRTEIDTIIDEMIAFAELGEFIDWPVRTYSSGMKARLAFTSLVFVEPEILLIDEMLSVGDYWFSQKATRSIRALCAKGRIVLLVSHGLESIVEMCSRCLWLEEGRLVADGDPATVTSAYRERVRRRDEAEMAARFSDQSAARSVDPVASITDVVVNRGCEPMDATILTAGEEACVRISLSVQEPMAASDVRLWIERLDGLRVTDSSLAEVGLSPSGLVGRVQIVVDMGPVILGPGLYKVHVELWSGEAAISTCAALFKVVDERHVAGGQPALRVPIRVSTRRREG